MDNLIFMLIGEYLHTIDQKNRLSIPSKFRKELGKTVIVTRGLDQCLFLYGIEEWNRLAEKLAQLPWGKAETRSFVRAMIAGAMDIDIDALGRILLPDYLKQYGKLEGEAMVVGLYNRVEIWHPELWKSYAEGAERQAEMIAEKLGELGMY
ncbi:MAG TPA: division/cell wall cluster transcriptional repressor MraZ [Candidatus Paceibacterota bacterium]